MSWFRNLQGQLSELANEVLSEATDEVADPETELQVANKKRNEAERQLVIEQSKVSKLEEKVLEQEHMLSAHQSELEMLTERHRTMILSRDEEIKKLKNELERLQLGEWQSTDVDTGTMEQNILDLQREVSHWKSLVEMGHDKDSAGELEQRLEEERRRKEEEITSLMELHSRNLNEMREMYEERISALEGVASSSTSNTDVLDAVLLEKEELLDTKRKLEELVRQRPSTASASAGCDDRMEVLDLVERSELTELEEKLREAQAEVVQIQHEELTQAYNDLNEEFEKYKELTATTAQDNNNQDLTRRIDLLKASLIEYEERYEMCKRENQETVAQLERLSGEFERLKSGFADVREQNKDADVSGEVDRLRAALEQAKTDRDRLRSDVDRFRSTVEGIDTELDMLRSSNRNLCEENEKMAAVIDRYTKSLNDNIQRSENSANESDAQGSSSLSQVQTAAVDNLNRELREEVTMLQERNRLLEEHREELQTSLKALQGKVDGGRQDQTSQTNEIADEVSALTAQLREALAANAEKTEECEKLRQQADDLEKEVTLRQSCVDEMIAQTNALQVQLQLAAKVNLQLKQQILEKDRSLNSMSEELNRKQPESTRHDPHFEQQSYPPQEVDQEKEELSGKIEQLNAECARLKEALTKAENQICESESALNTITTENNQLRQVATQKHAESVDYFARLEAAVAQIAVLEQKLADSQRQAEESLANERESREKLSRELQRLKDHLLLVEETSTVEAVEAEKRETELREQIRRLESTVVAADSDAAKTTLSMQSELSSLQERVVVAEESAVDWRSRYEDEKRQHFETNDALASLQEVVRELSADHEREAASASHRNMQLQENIRELTATVENLRAEMERLSLDKQTVEDLLESAKSSLNARQKIVEDLEVQLEELRASSRQSAESYRIDDVTLRQLFLSYFTAAPDKRADIALLLASILQYPPEDVHKIRQAISGRSPQRQGNQTGSVSLAEQFIRFLENESESASTAPHLPVVPQGPTPGPSIAPPPIASPIVFHHRHVEEVDRTISKSNNTIFGYQST
ncbi:unnamed protein product [Haemonchus placei]|uniref:GRIP domain-containing protein n=1 Tax=Haemonchus placei TaxID=6290 RepID=A0A158QNU1_HAEPC|nr:unnamed protein product [Haemonchus placei]